MKKLLLLTLVGAASLGKAQSYVGITLDPPAPTDTDICTLYVEMMFPYSDCIGTTNASLVGTSITGSSNYCMGMLATICENTDTLEFGPLAPGTYNVNLTLSAGSGLPSCSPPFVPNDNISYSFSVVPGTLGNVDFANDKKLEVYPNPANGIVNISWTGNLTEPLKVNLVDETGRIVVTQHFTGNTLTMKAEPGIYFVQIPEKGICRKLVIR